MERRARVREWVLRYGPPEVFSLLATLTAAVTVRHGGGGAVAVALAAVWAGNVAYFGLILLRDVWQTRALLHEEGRRYTPRVFGLQVTTLVVEFGFAEVLDSFLIRPALMLWMPRWLHSVGWGITVAKFVADITFYLPAILSYELGARRLRQSWVQGTVPADGGEGPGSKS